MTDILLAFEALQHGRDAKNFQVCCRRTLARRSAKSWQRAMPSARALLVASLLTEPPYGCLGPLRVTIAIARARFARKQWKLHKSTAKSRRLFRNDVAPANLFELALFEVPPQ